MGFSVNVRTNIQGDNKRKDIIARVYSRYVFRNREDLHRNF